MTSLARKTSSVSAHGVMRTAPTTSLLATVLGGDAAKAFTQAGRLWPLLEEPVAYNLDEVTVGRVVALRTLIDRLGSEPHHVGGKIAGPADAAKIFRHLALLDHEATFAAFLNAKNVVIAVERVATGGPSSVEVQPAQIFRPALLCNAVSLILAHNHPSGDPSPSQADRLLTKRATELGQMLGINVLDHIVVGQGGRAYAFSEDREVEA